MKLGDLLEKLRNPQLLLPELLDRAVNRFTDARQHLRDGRRRGIPG